MIITLPPHIEKFVREKVEVGQYATAEEIVIEALEILRDQEEFSPEDEAYLSAEVQRGIEQLDRGQYADFDAERIIAEKRQQRGSAQGQ